MRGESAFCSTIKPRAKRFTTHVMTSREGLQVLGKLGKRLCGILSSPHQLQRLNVRRHKRALLLSVQALNRFAHHISGRRKQYTIRPNNSRTAMPALLQLACEVGDQLAGCTFILKITFQVQTCRHPRQHIMRDRTLRHSPTGSSRSHTPNTRRSITTAHQLLCHVREPAHAHLHQLFSAMHGLLARIFHTNTGSNGQSITSMLHLKLGKLNVTLHVTLDVLRVASVGKCAQAGDGYIILLRKLKPALICISLHPINDFRSRLLPILALNNTVRNAHAAQGFFGQLIKHRKVVLHPVFGHGQNHARVLHITRKHTSSNSRTHLLLHSLDDL